MNFFNFMITSAERSFPSLEVNRDHTSMSFVVDPLLSFAKLRVTLVNKSDCRISVFRPLMWSPVYGTRSISIAASNASRPSFSKKNKQCMLINNN